MSRRFLVVALLPILLLATTGTAGARPRGGKLPNLPWGWTWPPSAAITRDGERCLDRIGALGIAYRRAPRTPKIATPIELPAMEIGGVRFVAQGKAPPFLMDCRFAEAFAEDGAAILRGLGVREVRFRSLHAVRNLAGRRILSRHAIGLAIDAWSFVTDDGTEHVVLTDYRRGDPVLHGIEEQFDRSAAFRHVLTPGKTPRSHRDHFHFEARTIGDSGPLPPDA